MLRTGIITSYLTLRLVVGSGFLDIYPGQAAPAHLQILVSGYATNQALAHRIACRPQALVVHFCDESWKGRTLLRLPSRSLRSMAPWRYSSWELFTTFCRPASSESACWRLLSASLY